MGSEMCIGDGHVPHPAVPFELSGHSLLLVPGPVCRLHCFDVLVEGAVVGVLEVSEVVSEFLVGEVVFDDRLGCLLYVSDAAADLSCVDLRALRFI